MDELTGSAGIEEAATCAGEDACADEGVCPDEYLGQAAVDTASKNNTTLRKFFRGIAYLL